MKKLIAVTMALLMLLSFASCKGNDTKETTAAPDSSTSQTVAANATTQESTTEGSSTAAMTTAEDSTTAKATTKKATTKKTTTKKATTKKATTKKATTKKATTKKTTTKKVTTKKATTKKKVTTKAPSTKSQIVSFFNAATKLVSTSKPGFSKTKTVTLTKMEPKALASISVIKKVVENFVGAGTEKNTVSKGSNNSKYIRVSSVTASDVTSATCTSSGNNYIITLVVKGSTNPEKGSSPIGRLTNDYKSRSEIKQGLKEACESDKSFKSYGEVTEKMNSATAKIVVNKTTKKISSYTIDYTYNAVIKSVKYTIITTDANVDAKGSVKYSGFKW